MDIKKDNLKFGLILGIGIPLFFMFITFIYEIDRFGSYAGMKNYLYQLNKQVNMFSYYIIPKVSLCIIPNLLLFFLFMWKNSLKSGRGVILATIFYAFGIMLLKFS